MPCATPPPSAQTLFHLLTDGPQPAADLTADAVELLVCWGWAFMVAGTVEISGVGRAHVGEVGEGILGT